MALALTATLVHAAGAEDLTALPFEQLLETEVVGAGGFARQITDAASAVSVLTRREIQEHGARSLAEVLDLMRGLHITYDGRYAFLGARGVGGARALAGRVMLFIDGVPAVDNLFDQLYLAQDALVDVALIERIEYAPGSGSALYGNNAFLGVINVVTRRGRDLDGAQAAALADSWGERRLRASWGRRLGDDTELLLSGSRQRGISEPSADGGRTCFTGCDGHAQQWLLKGRWGGWRAQLMASEILTWVTEGVDHWRALDRSSLLNIGHDAEPVEHGHLSLALTLGRYAYRWRDVTLPEGQADYAARSDGGWWVLDGKYAYTGWAGQRLALALQLRQDPVLRFVDSYPSPDSGVPEVLRSDQQRRAVGASVEHELRWTPRWRSTVGLRLDRRTGAPLTWSPRAALVWEPATEASLKLSHGRASRFASASEQEFGTEGLRMRESVTTSELVGELRREPLRMLSTLYHFHTGPLIGPANGDERLHGRGIELELQGNWRGWQLRASHAWQRARTVDGAPAPDAPGRVGKLLVSAPLAGDRWRLALTLRHTGGYADAQAAPLRGQRAADVTLLARQPLRGLDVRGGVRNLDGTRAPLQEDFLGTPYRRHANRQFWLEATWSLP